MWGLLLSALRSFGLGENSDSILNPKETFGTGETKPRNKSEIDIWVTLIIFALVIIFIMTTCIKYD